MCLTYTIKFKQYFFAIYFRLVKLLIRMEEAKLAHPALLRRVMHTCTAALPPPAARSASVAYR